MTVLFAFEVDPGLIGVILGSFSLFGQSGARNEDLFNGFAVVCLLEPSQLQFHTLLLLLKKILGKNQLETFVVDYDIVNDRHSA